ncbi:tRNA dihydrouridine(16) synthase DusC [Vibrio sp. JC009]|uniref:tRNA dihydrouridine(16) synthase DusC n=1 Tax=Vibrio sp. JC009 TaxID=2912314 RepID=UPI0023B02CDA|nr:tRNA dihydrouridine(16) synthase DusC [Vibrio sp. JC009]WED22643.1 tRNA dihydrouridine(16) synthase DusC [Vibrio sp. JC009]
MRVVLGPMEGVLDHLMREILTDINDYDLCVTEFVRVVDQLLPDHVFTKLCPELKHGSVTKSGTPVYLQLLGQDPDWMAENAVRAATLGAKGIDLNFGCPAKTVNKNRGGAALLQTPELIHQIVKACREAVDDSVPVSAKIRLGWDNPEDCFEIVNAIETAGASEITIHARTKTGGYKAKEIKWDYISQIKAKTSVPLIANGEIWGYQDGQDCIKASEIDSLMVCRGAFNIPNLGNMVKYDHQPMGWSEVLSLLLSYSKYEMKGDKGLYYPNRVKQWLRYLKNEYQEADELFKSIRTFKKADPIVSQIQSFQEAAIQ